LDEENEEREAELRVVSACRGVAGDGGSTRMSRWKLTDVSLPWVSCRGRRKEGRG
jgi:hypothetical protein